MKILSHSYRFSSRTILVGFVLLSIIFTGFAEDLAKEDSLRLRHYFDNAFLDGNSVNDRFAYVDSLNFLSDQTNNKRVLIYAHYANSRIYKRIHKYEEALNEANLGLVLCQQFANEKYERFIQMELVSIYLKLHMNELVVDVAEKALMEGLYSAQDSAIIYNNIGIAYYRLAKYDNGLKNLLISKGLYEREGYESGVATCLNNIGLVYEKQGDIDEALEFYKRSAKLYYSIKNYKNHCTLLSNIGITYLSKNMIPEAEKVLNRAMQVSDSIGDLGRKAKVLESLAYIDRERGNDREALLKLRKAMRYYNLHNNIISAAQVNYAIAKIYFDLGRLDEAEIFFKKVVGIAVDRKYYALASEVYESLSNLYKEEGDYEDAYYSRVYHEYYQDSLQDQNNAKELERLKLEYRVNEVKNKYENELTIREEKSRMIIQHQKSIRNLFIAAFVVTLFLTIWAVRNQIIVRRKNKSLKISNEIIRLERDKSQGLLNQTLAIFDNAIVGILLTDSKYRILRVNSPICELTGFSREELEGQHVNVFYSEETNTDEIRAIRDENFPKEGIVRYQTYFKGKNGKEYFCDVSGRPIDYNADSDQIWIIRDLSKEKETEQQLNIFERFIESSNQGLAMATLDKEVVYLNPYLKRIFNTDDFENRQLNSTYAEDFVGIIEEEVIPQVLKKGEWIGELKQYSADGRLIDTMEHFFLIRDMNDRPILFAAIITDITHLKETERALFASNEAKRQMLSIIGHDLRGPVGNMNSFLEMMLMRSDRLTKEKTKKYLEALKVSTTETYNLLENLLFWARNEKGEMLFQPELIDVNELGGHLEKLFYSSAKDRNLDLEFEITENTQCRADMNMLNTIIRNLISNALKFTNDGGRIGLRVEDKKTYMLFEVEDSGIGIKPEVQKKLFGNNELVTTTGLRDESGTGLGLGLCEKFVKLHGGEIWVESEVGKGSKFSFTIPNAYL